MSQTQLSVHCLVLFFCFQITTFAQNKPGKKELIVGQPKETTAAKAEIKKPFMDQIRFLYGNGDFKGLLALSLDTMKYAEQTGNKKGVARAAFLAGIALLNGTDDAEAEKYFLKGKQAAIEGGSDKYHAENEFRLGILRFIKLNMKRFHPSISMHSGSLKKPKTQPT